MEKSDEMNTINETITINVNNDNENIENKNNDDNKLSINKIDNNSCELKQMNSDINVKDDDNKDVDDKQKLTISKNCCQMNSCMDECKMLINNDDENCSNSSKESKEEFNDDNKNKSINVDNQDETNVSKVCCNLDQNNPENFNKSCQNTKSKETTTTTTTVTSCTKQKRKSRSTRKRLNAMISNASMHFSDTDSEGELVIMEAYGRPHGSPVKLGQGPMISVTMDDIENNDKSNLNPQHLMTISSTPVFNRSRCGSYVENLTDVDEIYSSDLDNETQQQNQLMEGDRKSLKINEINCQIETDVEDLSNDEIDQTIIYLTPRTDILCEFSGETITTKEGDGPFSIETRNRIFKESKINENPNSFDTITILPSTDSEDIEMSDDNDNNDDNNIQKASTSQRVLYDDLDVLTASQIVMTNVNKTDNMLSIKDTNQDDLNIGDCHTDVEDVD
ncbi:PREDICTED: putative uncharacterized protein DDB_G0282133 [Polistes canadensis]|uniref:putative uncharacterized protein DDB_G0282133 n=1 Tax=Polistes canadensis TaxID=91411 RepID=UPI000718CC77|nr:PREDICTED: putative uncharacterized protein DDB_G0282133 [Polistes canadensis]